MKQFNITYDKAKDIENKVTDYYEQLFKRVDPKSTKGGSNQYDFADLIMYDSKMMAHCLEVKTRSYTYGELLELGSILVEEKKLINIRNKYGCSNFTLITITKDNKIIKSKVNDSLEIKEYKAPISSCWDRRYIKKRMYVIYPNNWELVEIEGINKSDFTSMNEIIKSWI